MSVVLDKIKSYDRHDATPATNGSCGRADARLAEALANFDVAEKAGTA